MAKTPNNGALTQACSVLTHTILGTLIIMLLGFRTMKLWHPRSPVLSKYNERSRLSLFTVGGSVHTYIPKYICVHSSPIAKTTLATLINKIFYIPLQATDIVV